MTAMLFAGIYLTIVMALTSMSVIMTVFVLNLHHRGPNKHAVPFWLKDILINKLSPYLCLQEATPDSTRYYNNEERFIKNMSLKITLDNIQQALQNEAHLDKDQHITQTSINSTREPKERTNTQGNLRTTSRHEPLASDANRGDDLPSVTTNHIGNSSRPTPETVRGSHSYIQQQHIYQYNPQTSQFYSQTGSHMYPIIIDRNSNQSNSRTSSPSRSENHREVKRRSNSALSKTNEEILNSLKRILEKHEKEDRDYEVVQEWRRVAQCVDRILFFIFLIATFSSTIGILVIAPAFQ